MDTSSWLETLKRWHFNVPEEGFDMPPRSKMPQLPNVKPTRPIYEGGARWTPEQELPLKRFDPNTNARAYQQRLIENWLRNLPASEALEFLRQLETESDPYAGVRG